ncbi:hypothetical protein [Parendozoicomonas haliclonae]|uniref:Fimbrial protein n=1 Tax=Parendozoicomonas haliclonae TaxID=1960125 RepID=A0A1X7AG42_9GAMM|nr:hypothetical protein [Parendozoicomonas haliclonae]SMA39283.1 hypothetical protein EHSB41UT_01000 [Parendozoicomonas haliclonae]
MRLKVLALIMSMGVTGGAFAATDSQPGDNSATFKITYEQAEQAKIWGLDNVTITKLGEPATDNACIYSNVSDSVQLTLQDTNFELVNSVKGTKIDYRITVTPTGNGDSQSVEFNKDSKAPQDIRLINTSVTPDMDCGNGNIQVSINTDPAYVAAGKYTDTVTMVVTPN